MTETKTVLTLCEQIDRALDGRSQISVIKKMNNFGCGIDDVKFSRKKNGHEQFTALELKVLSKVLGTRISISEK
jgi:hypothetical protein